MKIIRASLLTAIFLFTALSGYAGTNNEAKPSIKASINKKRIFIGDRIRYKIEITSPYDLDIELPKFKDSKIGDCEIKDAAFSARKSFFGKRAYTYWFDITSFYVGARSVPPIEIKYRPKGRGDWKKLVTSELQFKVESVLPKAKLKDIRDIKGPIYPFSLLKFLAFVLSGLFALWLIVKLLIKIFVKKIPPKLPHEIAIEEIDAARKKFGVGGEVKDYYVAMSDAIRRYIESVFDLRAPEMTTQEFLASLGDSSRLSAAYKDLLKGYMEACDLVKFAKYSPGAADIESIFQTAKKFIDETAKVYFNGEAKR